MSAARPKSTSGARSAGRNYAKPTHSSRPNSRAQQLADQQALSEKRQIVGQYMLGKTIGEGTFGKVKLAAHMPTGEKVAVKILEKSRIKEAADVRRVNREIKILKKARHPNVIQLYEVLDTQNAIYLIMECCDGGEMFDFIVAQKRVNEVQACKFFHQIVEGVDEIHKNEITHRDLKPENLLLKASPDGWIVKVVDFGLSNTHEGNRLLATACGSPCYAAPEMIAGKKYVGPLADIWSMGVILFALVCGYLPFEDPNTAVLYKKILAGDYKAPKFISPEVRDLIARILETDPRRRYTMQDIRQHVWYTMVPESDIPKEGVDVYNDERTRTETVTTLGQAGIDTQSLLDGLASHACNSLTAMYYLYEQKQRNLRARSTNQQQSRNDIASVGSEVTGFSGLRSAPESTTGSRQPSAGAPTNPNTGTATGGNSVTNAAPANVPVTNGPPNGMPLHGVYRPVPPGQTPVVVPAVVSSNVATDAAPVVTPVAAGSAIPPVNSSTPSVAAATAAQSNSSRPAARPVPPTNTTANVASATSGTQSVQSGTTNGAVNPTPLVTLNMAPYLAAPPLLQQQQRQQQNQPVSTSPTINQNKSINANNNQQHNGTTNMPSLDMYMKQGAQLPSIQNPNTGADPNNTVLPTSTNPMQRPLAVPPLQFSQQQQLQAQQKPIAAVGGSQSARTNHTNTNNNGNLILGSLTARPGAPSNASNNHHGKTATNTQNTNRPPSSSGPVVPAQQHQLLAVQEGELPVMIPTALSGADTESSGGRPNTRRSRVRSRGVPGMGHLDEEATNGLGPAIGSLDEPDSVGAISQPMQQMQIQPMNDAFIDTPQVMLPTPLISPSSIRTGGGFSSIGTAAVPSATSTSNAPAPTDKVVPEQPAAARASSAQGGRRGRNLVTNNNSNNPKPSVGIDLAQVQQKVSQPQSQLTPTQLQQQASAREEAAKNKAQQQTSFMLS